MPLVLFNITPEFLGPLLSVGLVDPMLHRSVNDIGRRGGRMRPPIEGAVGSFTVVKFRRVCFSRIVQKSAHHADSL